MGNFNIAKINDDRKFLRDLVYEALLQSFREEKFKPGDQITEKEIAESLGVSRTPVREALYRMLSTGLIKMLPHRGFEVSQWSLREIKDIMAVRVLLEKFAIKLAIQNITSQEIEGLKSLVIKIENLLQSKEGKYISELFKLNSLFHDKIVLASKNKILFEIMTFLKDRISGFRFISLSSTVRLEDSFKEHRDILDAIIKKDSNLAERLISEHIQIIESVVSKKLKLHE
jgi:DNA-binding GntR family transcriptional regulator